MGENADSERLLTELSRSVQKEILLLPDEGRVHEVGEADALHAVRRLRDLYLASGSAEHWAEVSASLTRLAAGEQREVETTLRTLATERERSGYFIAAMACLPLLLVTGLIWQMISQQRKLEAEVDKRTFELQTRASELAEVDQQRRQFFAKLGHEMRTPLTIITAEVELAMADNASANRVHQALLCVKDHVGLIARRLSDLLALARSEAGELVLDKAPTEVAGVVSQAAELIRPLAERRSVDLEVIFEEVDDIEVLADKSWLEHAILALLDNAIKVSEQGQSICLTAKYENRCVVVDVSDHGPGVALADLSDLVREFKRGRVYSNYAGTGLGLAVVNWVAQQHGGDFSFNNRQPTGFSASLRLPVL